MVYVRGGKQSLVICQHRTAGRGGYPVAQVGQLLVGVQLDGLLDEALHCPPVELHQLSEGLTQSLDKPREHGRVQAHFVFELGGLPWQIYDQWPKGANNCLRLQPQKISRSTFLAMRPGSCWALPTPLSPWKIGCCQGKRRPIGAVTQKATQWWAGPIFQYPAWEDALKDTKGLRRRELRSKKIAQMHRDIGDCSHTSASPGPAGGPVKTLQSGKRNS